MLQARLCTVQGRLHDVQGRACTVQGRVCAVRDPRRSMQGGFAHRRPSSRGILLVAPHRLLGCTDAWETREDARVVQSALHVVRNAVHLSCQTLPMRGARAEGQAAFVRDLVTWGRKEGVLSSIRPWAPELAALECVRREALDRQKVFQKRLAVGGGRDWHTRRRRRSAEGGQRKASLRAPSHAYSPNEFTSPVSRLRTARIGRRARRLQHEERHGCR